MKDINDCEILEFENQKYNLKVGFDDDSKLLKVTMINIDTKKEIAINISGLIPHGATPDYVLLNDKVDEKLINKLKELNLLTNHTGIFARFNLEKVYQYDKDGVKAFLDYHTHPVEYEDKGKTVDEVKANIRTYTEELLKSKEVIEYLEDMNRDTNTDKYVFMYSLVDKKNPQNSVIAYCEENGDFIHLISPYEKGIENKFEIVPDWQFNFNGGMLNLLTHSFEIIEVDKYTHYPIWEEIYNTYLDDEENKYEKGIQKYLKYCKKNKITKDYIQKVYDMKYFTEDIMKFYKPKDKERL